jgi:F-type H+-transporting ATPase subunit b
MEIDWFTLIAQIVNFMVLVFLLKFFLYDRIIGVIDKREEQIADRLEDSERKQREAEQRRRSLQEEQEDIRRRKSELVEKAREEAAQNRERLVEKAREEVDELRARWMEGLKRQKESFVKQFRRGAGDELVATARKVLGDLADNNLEEAIVRAFIDRLHHLSDEEQKELNRFLAEAEESVSIRSGFELSSRMRQSLSGTLVEVSGNRITEDRIGFEIDTEAPGGVVLSGGGNRIGWSIENYLSSLDRFVTEALDREGGV